MTTPVATNTNNIATTTMAIFGMPDDVCAGTGAACAGTVSALTVTAVTDSSEECRGAASRLVVAVIDGGTAATLAAEVETAGEIVAPTTTGVPHLLQNFTRPPVPCHISCKGAALGRLRLHCLCACRTSCRTGRIPSVPRRIVYKSSPSVCIQFDCLFQSVLAVTADLLARRESRYCSQ